MAGYVGRQEAAIAKAAADESVVIPPAFEYASVIALSREAREKLERQRPRTLGMAGRIPGVSPADVAILGVMLQRRRDAVPVHA